MAKAQERAPVVQPQDQSIRHIPLTKGQIAIVDADVYAWLARYSWQAIWNSRTRSFYAIRKAIKSDPCGWEGRTSFYMHREILGLAPGDKQTGDHIKVGYTLDNRRSNLRVATYSQNLCNTPKRRTNTSGFKGVTFVAKYEKWQAQISLNGRNTFLGFHATAEQAHTAYCEAAKQHYGEFAHF